MKIIYWNCRGAGGQAVFTRCRKLAQEFKPEIFCLAETKLDTSRDWKLRNIFGQQWCISSIPAIGFSGGITLAWKLPLNINTFWWSRQALYAIVTPDLSPPWILATIYASTRGAVRKELWTELKEVANLGMPLCIGGDLNTELFHNYTAAALRAIMNTRMPKGTCIRDHILKMIAHFNEAERGHHTSRDSSGHNS